MNFVNPFNFLPIYITVYVVYLAVVLIWWFANFCPSIKFKLRHYSFIAIACIAATASHLIEMMPTMITDQFTKYFRLAKYLTCHLYIIQCYCIE